MDAQQDSFPPIVDLTKPQLNLTEPLLIARIAGQANAVVAGLAGRRVSYRDSIYGFLRHMGENEVDKP